MSSCKLEKRGNIYILTITGNNEHRLNPTLITQIQSSLSQIKSQFLRSRTPSALITTGEGKFFSNGFDLSYANSSRNPDFTKRLMNSQLKALISDLISFPMPTIAAINGHASAAGMILAIAHDFVVMRRDRGFLYMSEVEIGLVIPPWFMALLRAKIGGDWGGRRRVVLLAEKVTAEKGMREIGVVDATFDGVEATVNGAVEMGESLVKRAWDGVAYAENRKVLLKDVLDLIQKNDNEDVDGSAKVGDLGIKPRL